MSLDQIFVYENYDQFISESIKNESSLSTKEEIEKLFGYKSYLKEIFSSNNDIIKNINIKENITLNNEEISLNEHEKDNISISPYKVNKYLLNKSKLKKIFLCIGYKYSLSSKFASEIFNDLVEIIYHLFSPMDNKKINVFLSQNLFFSMAKSIMSKTFQRKVHLKRYFFVAYLIIEQKIPLIILLGGTSGTGKSTISTNLAELLNISNVISTDHIRHIMRNFISKDECPILFSSSYDAWKCIKNSSNKEIIDNLCDDEKIIYGYKEQSNIVSSNLESVIESLIKSNESAIIEGVHIRTKTIFNLLSKYKYILPFFIYIGKRDLHKERFVVRSKNMTLVSSDNKYVKNLDNIRLIQSYILKCAETNLIPAIDNNNVDKGIGIIQQTILSSVREIIKNDQFYDGYSHCYINFFNVFKNIKNKVLSSKEALSILQIHHKIINDKIDNKKEANLSDGEDSKRKNSYIDENKYRGRTNKKSDLYLKQCEEKEVKRHSHFKKNRDDSQINWKRENSIDSLNEIEGD